MSGKGLMMEASVLVTSKADVRAIICFQCLGGVSGNKIYLRLCNVFGECDIMSKRTVYQWVEKFKVGRSNTEDETGSG